MKVAQSGLRPASRCSPGSPRPLASGPVPSALDERPDQAPSVIKGTHDSVADFPKAPSNKV